MSKMPRRESNEDELETLRCSGSTKSKTLMLGLVKIPARQRHLYLVLQDWERGYSIHRLGEDDFTSGSGSGSAAGLDARPAKCPLVRIQAKHKHVFSCSFAAHGTKILAMQPVGFCPGIPVFDTETMEMAVYPPTKTQSFCFGRSVFTSVGDRLVAFVHGYLEVLLGPEPPPPTFNEPVSWSWTSAEQRPPFGSFDVNSYALHPDGRTIFMSAKNRLDVRKRNSTFSLDTERVEWTYHGDWLLPFKGQAHYDRELDAWVGICRFEQGAGRLCCCDVPPAAADAEKTMTMTMPAWKLGNDVFFDEHYLTGHEGATLVYMGDSRFCLLESRRVLKDDPASNPRLRVLAMTSFGLKYDRVGELVTSQYRACASISYQTVHNYCMSDLDTVAFWM